MTTVDATHPELGRRYLHCEGEATLLFTEDETNTERLFGTPNATPYVQDAIHRCLVAGETGAVNPEGAGTKAAAHYRLSVEPGTHAVIRLRLTDAGPDRLRAVFGPTFDTVMTERQREPDEFYAALSPASVGEKALRALSQALARGYPSTWVRDTAELDELRGRADSPLPVVKSPQGA